MDTKTDSQLIASLYDNDEQRFDPSVSGSVTLSTGAIVRVTSEKIQETLYRACGGLNRMFRAPGVQDATRYVLPDNSVIAVASDSWEDESSLEIEV